MFDKSGFVSSRRLAACLSPLLLAACAPSTTQPHETQAVTTPPSGPTQGGAALASACTDRDGWSDAAPPAQVYGNVYYVGSCGITALLITSPEGHILIDGATAEAAPGILANIRALGFNPRDVRVILNTHEHIDHAGGLAALKQATGAQFMARAPAQPVFDSGQVDPADPQLQSLGAHPIAPIHIDKLISDGETVRVGDVVLTAHATPGHAMGGTSWTWRSCVGSACYNMVYADSLNAFAAGSYRFTDHPEWVAGLRRSMALVAALPCDILLSPHPGSTDMFARLAGSEPLVNRSACGAYVAAARTRLDTRLAAEAAGTAQ